MEVFHVSKEAIHKLEGEGKQKVVDMQVADKSEVVDVKKVDNAGVIDEDEEDKGGVEDMKTDLEDNVLVWLYDLSCNRFQAINAFLPCGLSGQETAEWGRCIEEGLPTASSHEVGIIGI